jgi:hypothetical protein
VKIAYPPHGWLVAFRSYDEEPESLTLGGVPLNLPDDDQEGYSVNDWETAAIILPLWYPIDLLRRHPAVREIRRLWYLLADEQDQPIPDGVVLPEGEYVDQCGFPFTMWFDRDAFLGAWAQGDGCDAIRILWEVYEPAEGDIRRLAGEVLDGETGLLPILADALEESKHPHAKSVRKMVKANPAPKPPKGYSMPADPDPELTDAQRGANGPCSGCGQENVRLAQRVKKEGATQGRIFIKCRSCSRFDWVGEPPPSAPAKGDAGVAPCPKCGKPRRSLVVKKEGPNKGRTFYKCTDSVCDSFEWASEG